MKKTWMVFIVMVTAVAISLIFMLCVFGVLAPSPTLHGAGMSFNSAGYDRMYIIPCNSSVVGEITGLMTYVDNATGEEVTVRWDPREKRWNDSRPSITIGFVGSYKLTTNTQGAIPLALDHVNRNMTLPFYDLRFVTGNVGFGPGASKRSVQMMHEMWHQGVMGFIGANQRCHHEALVAAALNVPLFSFQCTERLSDKAEYSTFARTIPLGLKFTKPLFAVLKKYDWRHVCLVVGEQKHNQPIADDVELQRIRGPVTNFPPEKVQSGATWQQFIW